MEFTLFSLSRIYADSVFHKNVTRVWLGKQQMLHHLLRKNTANWFPIGYLHTQSLT